MAPKRGNATCKDKRILRLASTVLSRDVNGSFVPKRGAVLDLVRIWSSGREDKRAQVDLDALTMAVTTIRDDYLKDITEIKNSLKKVRGRKPRPGVTKPLLDDCAYEDDPGPKKSSWDCIREDLEKLCRLDVTSMTESMRQWDKGQGLGDPLKCSMLKCMFDCDGNIPKWLQCEMTALEELLEKDPQFAIIMDKHVQDGSLEEYSFIAEERRVNMTEIKVYLNHAIVYLTMCEGLSLMERAHAIFKSPGIFLSGISLNHQMIEEYCEVVEVESRIVRRLENVSGRCEVEMEVAPWEEETKIDETDFVEWEKEIQKVISNKSQCFNKELAAAFSDYIRDAVVVTEFHFVFILPAFDACGTFEHKHSPTRIRSSTIICYIF